MGKLRKVTAILKLGVALLPALTLAGGIGALIGCGVKSVEEEQKTIDLFVQTEDFKNTQEEKLALAQQAVDEGIYSENDFEHIKNFVESDDFIKSELNSSVIKDKDVQAHFDASKKFGEASMYCTIPFGVGALSLLSYITKFHEFFFVRENMRENYIEELHRRREKERKQEKKDLEREEKLYSEEIVHN